MSTTRPHLLPGNVVLLDFGDTLVESLRDPAPVWQEVLLRRGLRFDPERFGLAEAEAWHRWEPRFFELAGASPSLWDSVHAEIVRSLGLQSDLAGILAGLREAFTSPRWHPPFPETESVLRALTERGRSLHVVSNNSDWLPPLVRQYPWARYLSSVSYSQEAGADKPDPRVFALALRRAGASPENAIHVGDSLEADVAGARGAGVRAIWVDRTIRGTPRPVGVEVVPDLTALLRLLAP